MYIIYKIYIASPTKNTILVSFIQYFELLKLFDAFLETK